MAFVSLYPRDAGGVEEIIPCPLVSESLELVGTPFTSLMISVDLQGHTTWATVDEELEPQVGSLCEGSGYKDENKKSCVGHTLQALRRAVRLSCTTDNISTTCDQGEQQVCLAGTAWGEDSAAARAIKGRRVMSVTRAVIGAIGFNVGPSLGPIWELLQETASAFALGSRIVVFENDSTDGTAQVLRGLCEAEARATCAIEVLGNHGAGANGADSPVRFEILASCRNRLVDLARSSDGTIHADVIMLVDLDVLEVGWLPPQTPFAGTAGAGWTLDGIATTFTDGLEPPHTNPHHSWAAVCSNSVWLDGRRHYDTLAYRNGRATGNTLVDISRRHALMYDTFKGPSWIPVESCFGGLAIYRVGVFNRCAYSGGDCEHVMLHNCVKDHQVGRIFVNPLMVLPRDGSTKNECQCVRENGAAKVPWPTKVDTDLQSCALYRGDLELRLWSQQPNERTINTPSVSVRVPLDPGSSRAPLSIESLHTSLSAQFVEVCMSQAQSFGELGGFLVSWSVVDCSNDLWEQVVEWLAFYCRQDQFKSSTLIASSSAVRDRLLLWSEGFKHFAPDNADYLAPNEVGYAFGQKTNISEWVAQTKAGPAEKTLLLIGCRDYTFPDDFDSGDIEFIYSHYHDIWVQNLNRPQLTAWQSRRTQPLPIGIDFHTLEKGRGWGLPPTPWYDQLEELVLIRLRSPDLVRRETKLLVSWSPHSVTSNRHAEVSAGSIISRPDLYAEARRSPVCDIVQGSRSAVWKTMADYAFVFVPIGNGLDTHRLWEALALGCIVIAQDSPTAREFATYFPIVLTTDLESVSLEDLTTWQRTHCAASLDSLRLSGWLEARAAGVVGIPQQRPPHCTAELRIGPMGMARDPTKWAWSRGH